MTDYLKDGTVLNKNWLTVDGRGQFTATKLGDGDSTIVAAESDFPAPVAGVITIDKSYFVTKFVTISPGIRMNFVGSSGAIFGLNAAVAGLFFNIDGSAISGPAVLSQLTLDNPNTGASSKLLTITSPGGRTVRVEYCSIRGYRAGTISNCFGAVTIDTCFLNGISNGFILDGIIGAFQAVYCTTGNNPQAVISWDVLSTCTIVGAVTWRNCNFLTLFAADRGIRISDGATLPTGALPTTILGSLISGCFRTGPGLTLEQGPGYVPVTSVKLLAIGNGSLRDSNTHSFNYFFNATTPAQMVYTGIGTWDVIVSDNTTTGGVTTVIQDDSTERFTLVKNSRQDWYIRYDGPQKGIEKQLAWAVDVTSVTANNDLEFRITKQTGGVGAFVDLPSTHGICQQVNRKQAIQGAGVSIMDPGDCFRFEVRPLVASNNSEYYRIQLRLY